jgi:predicted TIM-barrel fold metal-dependent hydrolase
MHQRVRDMNANGVLAAINFPTAAGFACAWLANKPDRALSAMAIAAYSDWQIDELAGSYPGRFIPMGILPLWDTDACVLELERIAAKGSTTVSFPETPYANDLPGFYGDHWDAVFAAAERLQIALSMHIGGASIC